MEKLTTIYGKVAIMAIGALSLLAAGCSNAPDNHHLSPSEISHPAANDNPNNMSQPTPLTSGGK